MKQQIKFYVWAALSGGAITFSILSTAVPNAECAAGICEDACTSQFNKCRGSGKKIDACSRELFACKEKCKNP